MCTMVLIFPKALRQLNPEWKAWVQDNSIYGIGGLYIYWSHCTKM